jgi:hypothetical protein
MKRNFLYIFAVTLFALLVLWLSAPGDNPGRKAGSDGPFLAEAADSINNVSRVEIVAAGNELVATLEKSENSWKLVQMGGYRADWQRLRTLLAALAEARVVESKTSKPEYYARLGVEDIAAADAGGVLVKLDFGDRVTGVLVGKASLGRPGQYVRLQDVVQSALIDREIEVSTLAQDWVDSTIVDINSSEVAEVEIIHPSGERVLVTRISADQTDFDLVGLSPEREIKSSWAVNSLGSVMGLLTLESVRAEDTSDWSDAIKLRLLMFSGVEILADILEAENEYLMRLQAGHPAAAVVGGQDKTMDEQSGTEERALSDITQVVDDINEKTSGWTYVISKTKYDAMAKKPEDLLKPLESL